MIRGLIFDFDGLILDTEAPDYEAWAALFKDHGCSMDRDWWCAQIGLAGPDVRSSPHEELERLTGRNLDREELRRRHMRQYLAAVEMQTVLPGVLEYLQDAADRGLKIAVASSSNMAWVEGHLARLGLLSRFEHLLCSDHVSRTKPDPELYLAALDRMGLAPGEAIAFEDSRHGLHAARAAGLFTVAVPTALTASLDLSAASLKLGSLAEMPLAAVIALAESAPQ